MTNYNDPDKVEARATQEDPIIMYLIVRESLGMSLGKTAAQCAHASQMITLEYFKLDSLVHSSYGRCGDEICNRVATFQDWLDKSFRKVVLRADDKEWKKLKGLPNHILVIDAGLTQIPENSETVLGFWPIRKSQAPKFIKKLQVLK